MKITYNKNPLFTTIELDEQEKKDFWNKIKFIEMEELLFDAHFHLANGEYFDIEKARKAVNPDYYLTDEKSPLDKRCDLLLETYLEELQSFHIGDCTCVACSCMKCHAESILGIDTIKGLPKHSAYKINAAFGEKNSKSIEEAIEYLANYEPTASWEGWEQHIPRWKSEAKVAHDWLLNYKNQHLNSQN